MYCKYCYKMIDDGSDFCSFCGKPQKGKPKKPIYKRWWFWALLVVIVIAAFSGGNDDKPAAEQSGSSTVQADPTDSDINEALPLPTELATEATEPIDIFDGATMGEKNALHTAMDYLDYSAFSYSGLIDQLEFEGYTNAEATFAAKNCGADWNEQAAICAKSYLEFTSFSRQGLIEQLLYEGFTQSQAEFGVQAAGY